MNKVNLLGRLAKDPELRFTASGKAVVTFSIAVNRAFSKEKEADFFNVNAWGKTAEFIANYFTKGQMMALSGRIQNRSWEDSEGKKRYATDIVAEEVYFTGGKNETSNTGNDTPLGLENDIDDEDVPF